jgi:hypothetical protein
VAVPQRLQEELREGMEAAGIPVPETEERWQQALTALKVPCLLCSSAHDSSDRLAP